MAKSLRSKWRRKCRAVKRIRYGEKELAQLKKTLGIDDTKPADVKMNDISEIATVTDAKTITAKQNAQKDEPEAMDDGTVKRVFNPKTMKDQFGNYPIWMHQRRVNKRKNKSKANRKNKQKKSRK